MATGQGELATTEFFESVRTGRLQRIRRLLDEQPALLHAVDSNGETAVLEALHAGQPGALDVLLEGSPELDIFEAAALGRSSRILELLGQNEQLVTAVAADGCSALQLAAHFGRTDAVRLLLEHGADAMAVAQNSRRSTPLHAATGRGHLDTVRLLLEAGADQQAADGNGETVLQLAERKHDAAMLELLRGAEKS
jgi:uncharacterized protein